MPLVSRTRATLRSAEFGFLGVWVKTRTQTPRFCGLSCSAGLLVLVTIFLRPARTSWLIVGIFHLGMRIADGGLAPIGDRSDRSRNRPINPQSAIRDPQCRDRNCFRPRSLAAWRLKTL